MGRSQEVQSRLPGGPPASGVSSGSSPGDKVAAAVDGAGGARRSEEVARIVQQHQPVSSSCTVVTASAHHCFGHHGCGPHCVSGPRDEEHRCGDLLDPDRRRRNRIGRILAAVVGRVEAQSRRPGTTRQPACHGVAQHLPQQPFTVHPQIGDIRTATGQGRSFGGRAVLAQPLPDHVGR